MRQIGAPPPRPRERRFDWLRLSSGFTRHPKWRVVARMSGVELADVVSIVTDMLCRANKAKPRGSLADFSVLECAAALDLPPDSVRAVDGVLRELGWIDDGNDFISTWYERQPDQEDSTAAERMRRYRAKKRQERGVPEAERPEAKKQSASAGAVRMRRLRAERAANRLRTRADEACESVRTNAANVRPVRIEKASALQGLASVTRAHRNVTPRQDKTLSKTSSAEAAATTQELSMEQIEISVAQAIGIRSLTAKVTVSKWLKGLDLETVAGIVASARAQNLLGQAFERVVNQRIDAARRERTAGLALPFGLSVAKK